MENKEKQLDRYVEDMLFYYDLPGLAVSVSIGDKSGEDNRGFQYKRAVGYKNYETKEPLREDQFFHMASVSKLFTAAGIIQLCESGKLCLADLLADLLPFVSIDDRRYEEITLRHMLTHTSGMADVEDYHWDAPRLDEGALKDYALSPEVAESKLLWSPAEGKFRYSNIAYELLGLIIAEVSGMTYEEYMRTHIFEPLEMNDSTFLTFERAGGSLKLQELSKANMAMPHVKDRNKHIVLADCYPYNREHGPSSTLTSNLSDLSKWARAHLQGTLFGPELYEQIWKTYATVPNNKEEMGLGWFMRKQEGYRLCGHEGTDDGFRASFWICPERKAHIIVAANISGAAVKKINKKLFEIMVSP